MVDPQPDNPAPDARRFGIVLALGVPAIAWLEQSALLLLLIAIVVVAVIAPFFWHRKPNWRRL
jgi:hypothetical protein